MNSNNKYIFLAKSNSETIEEHTQKVLDSYQHIKQLGYLDIDEDTDFIVKKLLHFHDEGKRNPSFQNRMLRSLKKETLYKWENGDVPHEWLSPAFIGEDDEHTIKNTLKKLGLNENIFFDFFIFVILSHHHRENAFPDDHLIEEIIKWIKENYNFNVDYYYRVQNLLNKYNDTTNRDTWKIYFPYRIKWLGLLYKCDYSASANINPEIAYNGNYYKDLKDWFLKNNWQLKEFQKEAIKYSDKSCILVASTGIGKTECAMNWINGKKAFYLLGIRIAVNVIYKRFLKIFKENVALLHGESSIYLAHKEDNEHDYDIEIAKVKQLSYPITIATADQLVTSVFKFPGFELMYFTTSYSKIVVDEIQSFAPAAIAAIVVFLKEIHSIGGKFMLMTATLPSFIKEEFENIENVYFPKPILSESKRHKLGILNYVIDSENFLRLVRQECKNKKILIICNTVKKAQNLYELLKDLNPNLIHSRFILSDRRKKEEQIMSSNSPCIWITTQVVEASLDIDFDMLFTENASVEALFQRFGRCYRKREYEDKKPNIYVLKSEPSNIYDPYLFNKTWDAIQLYDKKLLSEEDKQDIIEEIFKDIDSTNYYQEYKKQKELLEIGYRTRNKSEAEFDFRQITNNYVIIPDCVYTQHANEIKALLSFIDNTKNDRIDRIKKQAELMEYTIPLQIFRNQINMLSKINSNYCKKKNIWILNNTSYNFEKGLEIKEVYQCYEENII